MTEQTPRPDDEAEGRQPPADPPTWPAPTQPGPERETASGTSDATGYPYAGGDPTVQLSKGAPDAQQGPYGQAPYGQPQYGQPQYGQHQYEQPQYQQPPQPYGQPAPYTGGGGYAGGPTGPGQPGPPTPASTIVLLVLSGIATVSFWLTLAGIVPLIMSIVALTKNRQDPEGAKRLTRIGWWVFAGLIVLGILLIIGFFALLAVTSTASTGFGSTY